MQSSLTKQITQTALRYGSNVSRATLRQALFVQAIVPQTTSFRSLTLPFQRSFAEKINFGKINQGSLAQSSAMNKTTNVKEVLEIIGHGLDKLKADQIILALKTIAKHLKSIESSEITAIQEDERYKVLTKRALEHLDEYSDRQLLDFMFWFRRARLSKLPTYLSSENIEQIISKIKIFVDSKSYSFRNLASLYYDLAFLNLNADNVVKEILNTLKADPSALTPFTAVQIIQAYGSKNIISVASSNLIDLVQRNVSQKLSEYDSEQKCLIFKTMSDLELHTSPPKYRVPGLLYDLRADLENSLEDLTENGLLNILDAYSVLPKEFQPTLLEKTKSLIFDAIRTTGDKVKSSFLVDFADKLLKLLKVRRVTKEHFSSVFDEVAKRLPDDNYLGRIRTLERLIAIYDSTNIKHEGFVDEVYKKIVDLNSPFFSGPIIQFLSQNGKDIAPLLDRFIEGGHVNRLNFYQRLQFYLALVRVDSDKHKDLKRELKTQLLSNPEETHRMIESISEIEHRNEAVDELEELAINSLKRQKGVTPDYRFYRKMFISVKGRRAREQWEEWTKENMEKAEKEELKKLTESFFSLDNITYEKVLVFTRIFEASNLHHFPVSELINGFKENRDFISVLVKNDKLFDRFIKRLTQLIEAQPKELKLNQVYSLLRKLESYDLSSKTLAQFAKKAFEIARASETPITQQLEFFFSLYLIEKKALPIEDAKQIYERNKESLESATISSKFLTYIAREDVGAQETESDPEIREKLKSLTDQLVAGETRNLPNIMNLILSFPPDLLEPSKDIYLENFKKALESSSLPQYFTLLESVPLDYFKTNKAFYFPFIIHLSNYLGKNFKKASSSELLIILQKFVDFGIKDSTAYNRILSGIGNHFQYYKSDDLCDIADAFTRVGIKQEQLLQTIFERVAETPNKFLPFARRIIQSFLRVGYNSPAVNSMVNQLVGLEELNPAIVLFLVPYVVAVNLENKVQVLQKLVPLLPGELKQQSLLRTYVFVYEYLRLVHKDKPELAGAIKKMLPNIEEVGHKILSRATKRAQETVVPYLKVMMVETDTEFAIDNFKVDLYLPETKTLVNLKTISDVNYGKSTLSGSGLIKEQIYKFFQGQGYNTVFVNLPKFNTITDHYSRVRFLTGAGIKENTDKYDFHGLQRIVKKKIIQALEEPGKEDEEVVEEGDKGEEKEPKNES